MPCSMDGSKLCLPSSFRTLGGVYRATDKCSNQRVILKEARPLTNQHPEVELDALTLLRREADFLSILSDSRFFPQKIDLLEEQGHLFLAEEEIAGIDVRQVFFELNPLVKPHSFTGGESQKFFTVFLRLCKNLFKGIEDTHSHGVSIGDISARNIIVSPDYERLWILDLEGGVYLDDDPLVDKLGGPVVGTAGFSLGSIDEEFDPVVKDTRSAGAIAAYLIFPTSVSSFFRTDWFSAVPKYVKDLGWPQAVAQLVRNLGEGTLSLKEAIAEIEALESGAMALEVPEPEYPLGNLKDHVHEISLGLEWAKKVSPGEEYPTDPFGMHLVSDSLGFGDLGVEYSQFVHRRVPEYLMKSLTRKLSRSSSSNMPPGFLTGSAGVGWAASLLGLTSLAMPFWESAWGQVEETDNASMFYGRSGIGMSMLQAFESTGQGVWVERSSSIASRIRKMISAGAGGQVCRGFDV